MKYQVALQGIDEAISNLARLAEAGADTTELMRPVSQTMLDAIEENFEREADPNTGTAWPALAESTIAARVKRGKWPGKMLQISQGGLASSMSASHGNNWAAAGSNKPYAAIQHFGGEAGRKSGRVTIPARPYLGLPEEHREEIIDITGNYLRKALNGG